MRATRAACDLDLYELAWLAGGPARVVDTALVALVRSGRLRAHPSGAFATVELTRRHPVEAAVLDAVGPSGHRSVDTIRWRVATDDRISRIGRELQQDGFLPRFRLSRGASRSVSTRAGQRALRQRRAGASPWDHELQVALGGRDALPDRALHASIFARPPSPARAAHALDFADGPAVAGRTRAAVLAQADRLGAWVGR